MPNRGSYPPIFTVEDEDQMAEDFVSSCHLPRRDFQFRRHRVARLPLESRQSIPKSRTETVAPHW